MNPAPGISAIAYAVPAATRSVRELAAAGALTSEPELLERFGFGRICLAIDETPYDLALSAASALMRENDLDPLSINLLIYGGSNGSIAFVPPRDAVAESNGVCDARRFQYPATRLQFDLGIENAAVMGIDQLACTSIFGAVRLARALCIAEGLERVLCVSSEFYPSALGREAITNCTSDAACAVLVDRNATTNRIVAGTTVTKGYFWSSDSMPDEVMASYFPTAVHVMRRTVCQAGWKPEDVDWVMPHNVSATSWDILFRLAALPNARLYGQNISRIGHTLAGDNFINMRDASDGGLVTAGDKLLLFSYGYGAHWTGLAIEA